MRVLSVSAANQRPDLRSGDQPWQMRGQLTSDSRVRRTLLSGDCHKWSFYKTPPAAPGPLPWQPGRMCSPWPGPEMPAPGRHTADWSPRRHQGAMSSCWTRDLSQQLTSRNWLAHLSSDCSSEEATYFVWKIVKVRLGKCVNHFSSSLRLFLLKYSHSQFIFYYSTTEEVTTEWAHHLTGRQIRCSRYSSWKCFNNMTKFLKSRNWWESPNFLWIGQLKLLLQRDLSNAKG